jgi:hypothetical protein
MHTQAQLACAQAVLMRCSGCSPSAQDAHPQLRLERQLLTSKYSNRTSQKKIESDLSGNIEFFPHVVTLVSQRRHSVVNKG